jgi:hypothetical protein
MASLSSEVASMSVTDSSSLGDNLTAWEVVDGDYDYRKSLSVRPKFSSTSKPVLRVFKKGDVFLSVGPGKQGKAKEFTRHQLEDGAWVSSIERHSRICAVQISAEVYAKKKKAQDNRESDQQNAEEKQEQEKNDDLAAKFRLVEQLIAENSANTSTFEFTSENGNVPVPENRTTGQGTKSTTRFLKDGTWKTTERHSWSKEYMNGACWGGGYDLDVFGKYFCNVDGNVAGFVTKVNYNPQSSGATQDAEPTVPEVHDFIKGTYVNETLTFSFVGNLVK